MYFCCNYDIIKKDGTKDEVRASSCFKDYYQKIKDLQEIHMYVLKDYNFHKFALHNSNGITISREQIDEYLSLLKEMGFKFEMQESTCIVKYTDGGYTIINGEAEWESAKGENEAGCYKFIIKVEENSIRAILILLHALRFIYEGADNNFVNLFLKFVNQKTDISLFNIFLICNYSPYLTNIHSILPRESDFQNYVLKLQTKEEIETLFNEDTNCKDVSKSLEIYFKKYAENHPDNNIAGVGLIREILLKNDSITEIVKQYEELCEKYM